MNDVDHALDVSQRLRELRDRLAELDRERAEVQHQIDECMNQLATVTGDRYVALAPDAKLRDQIVAYYRKHPDERFSASDVDDVFGRRLNLGNVRQLLARMAKDGDVVRVRHGVYRLAK